jgi:PAS domain S-box-containing protein
MKDQSKTKQVLIQELVSLRRRIAGLEQSESERKQADEALRESEQRLASIYNTVGDVIFHLAVEPAGQFRFISVNSAFLKVTGLSPEMVVGRTVNEIIPEPSLTMAIGKYRQAIAENTIVRWEEISDYPTGRLTGVVSIAPVFDDKGTCTNLVGSVHDITERKQAEEQLHASLQEKELLLREVHHRVKSNMQVISGLLDLQARSTRNPELTGMLNESQSRIQSMAMIHEKFYNSKDFTRIDLVVYVRDLSQELFQLLKINPGKIDLIVQTDGDVYVDIDKAIPCGLILNELISNALKHAFPGDRQGKLQILINETKNTEIEIVVRDNGVGLPDDVDIHQPRSVGLHLVNGLVRNQLSGQMEVRRDAGTEILFKFPL